LAIVEAAKLDILGFLSIKFLLLSVKATWFVHENEPSN
jgi:hypothetical protein